MRHTKSDIGDSYVKWLSIGPSNYSILYAHLYNIEFYNLKPIDINRLEDGLDLKYKFYDIFNRDHGYVGVSEDEFIDILNPNRCSMLEMMVALALRMEDDIMYDQTLGDRSHIWFVVMLESLGISDMTDDKFDSEVVDIAVNKFLQCEYKSDGSGSLFHIVNSERDLREVDIWYQMCWYLDVYYN